MSSTHSTYRRGFTLVELLVVIAIIGILVGMLLPAVQAVRESARRASCLNNIRQIVLASTSYQSANQKWPSGSTLLQTTPPNFEEYGESWAMKILGYMDESNMVDEYKASTLPTVAERLQEASSKRVPLFFCPSSPQEETGTSDPLFGDFTIHYFGSMGPNITPFQFTNETSSIPIGLNGVFSPRSSNANDPTVPAFFRTKFGKKYADMKDGSSNTIAFMEVSQSDNPTTGWTGLRPGWAFGSFNDSTTGQVLDAYSANSVTFGINSLPPTTDYGFNNHPMGSNHPGGCLVGMADGSARFVNEAIEIQILMAATGMKDAADDDLGE